MGMGCLDSVADVDVGPVGGLNTRRDRSPRDAGRRLDHDRPGALSVMRSAVAS